MLKIAARAVINGGSIKYLKTGGIEKPNQVRKLAPI